jgi:hypothetical protein
LKISIKDIKRCCDYSKSTFEVKHFLHLLKIEGTIFFFESVAELEETKKFEVYYCLFPSDRNTENAFPVPIRHFYPSKKNKHEQLKFMNQYFKNYYSFKKSDLSFFNKYQIDYPFIGKSYIWYFQTKSIEM